jgi:hypothetical protein
LLPLSQSFEEPPSWYYSACQHCVPCKRFTTVPPTPPPLQSCTLQLHTWNLVFDIIKKAHGWWFISATGQKGASILFFVFASGRKQWTNNGGTLT